MQSTGQIRIDPDGLCVFTDPNSDMCLPDVPRTVDEGTSSLFVHNIARKQLVANNENITDFLKFLGITNKAAQVSTYNNSNNEKVKLISTRSSSPESFYGLRTTTLPSFQWMKDFFETRMFTGGKTWCIWIRPVPTNAADRHHVRIFSQVDGFRLRVHPDDDTDPARLYLHFNMSGNDHIVYTTNPVLTFGPESMQFICIASDYTNSYIWHNGVPQALTVQSSGTGTFSQRPLDSIFFGHGAETSISEYYDIGMFLMYNKILSNKQVHKLFITTRKYF